MRLQGTRDLSRTRLSTSLGSIFYGPDRAKVKEGVTRRLQQETFVSLTGDIWTSIAIDAYLTLTVHFLSDAWEMCSVVLGTKPLNERMARRSYQKYDPYAPVL